MPPKKDAFADLFLSAAGSSPDPSLNSSLNDLSVREQKPQTSWSNLDILSNLGQTSRVSVSNTQASQNDAFDPFSIFDSKEKTLSMNVSSSLNMPNVSVNAPMNASSSVNVSSMNVSSMNVSSMNVSPSVNVPSSASASNGKQSRSDVNKNDISLLNDDFTDAFEPEPKQEIHESIPIAPVPERPRTRLNSVRSASTDARDQRDEVLAGLIDIGFPIEMSNRAIDEVGTDLQTCVNYIMNGSLSRGGSTSQNGKSSKSPPDLGATLQDLSADIFKTASWFIDKSAKTVIKNINQLQNKGPDDGMPAWMRNQGKYKERASERKEDGGVYEDYGVDEENINSEEIQRIIRLQRQREKERQKQRLSSSRPRESKEHPNARTQATALGASSPAVESTPPSRPVLAPSRAKKQPVSESAPSIPSRSSQTPSKIPSQVPSQTPSQTSSQAPSRVPSRVSQHSPAPAIKKSEEVDLLGLGGLSRAQKFRQEAGDATTYVLPSRRRQKVSGSRVATAEALNTFQQSDFDTFKAKATAFFTNGDYSDALASYTRCLEALPPKHELRIVITSNMALTLIKLGNYKTAKQHCDEGLALVGKNIDDADWYINDKVIKYWYVKLLTRKAESLEMLENFPESLECYMELVTKHGITDKKVMDAKRRINNIVNPPKAKPKPQPRAPPKPVVSNTEHVQKIRKQYDDEKAEDEMKFKLHDQVNDKITAWANGKEDNLRSLLMSLDEVIPARLGFLFLQKKITISDLMLTKKVKINYMKVISSIHPDKLNSFDLEDQMICQAVFVVLNKAWDTFKEQNGLV